MKPTTHATITRVAIQHSKGMLSNEICKNTHEIVQGSIDEDEAILSIVKRVKNWHFYRSEKSTIPKKIFKFFKTTSEDILDDRIGTFFKKEKGSKKYFNYLGRILHHIQDMSTPSHVMPIYHGPKFPLQLSLGMIEDHFETFMQKNDCIISSKNITQEISIAVVKSYRDIYKHAAEDMLKNILKVDEPIKNRPYSIFWKHHTEQESVKIKGFGSYGACHGYFKDLPQNNPHGITEETLHDIQEKITTHAIVNTCKALLLADSLYINSENQV